jgi:hypothetical protein
VVVLVDEDGHRTIIVTGEFGTGTLLSRSGTGDEERLEVRFDGDQIRKILAKFVTQVED